MSKHYCVLSGVSVPWIQPFSLRKSFEGGGGGGVGTEVHDDKISLLSCMYYHTGATSLANIWCNLLIDFARLRDEWRVKIPLELTGCLSKNGSHLGLRFKETWIDDGGKKWISVLSFCIFYLVALWQGV